MRWITLLLLFLVGCGGLEIGPTRIVIVRDAEPWPDLPEVLTDMQENSGAPADVWDVALRIAPAWYPISGPGNACLFVPPRHIDVRITGTTAKDSCLPHEFAHRWQYLEDFTVYSNDPHGEAWQHKEATLKASIK